MCQNEMKRNHTHNFFSSVAHRPALCEDPPLWSPYVVCVHIYICSVWTPPWGIYNISSSALHTRQWLLHCDTKTQWTASPSLLSILSLLPCHTPSPPRRVVSCIAHSCQQTSPRWLVLLPIFHFSLGVSSLESFILLAVTGFWLVSRRYCAGGH